MAGVGLLLGVPFAWSPLWRAASGVLLTVLGAGALVLAASRWFR